MSGCAKAKSAAVQARADTLLGNTLAAEARASILSACQNAIRGKLRAPSQAQFATEATVLPDTRGWSWARLRRKRRLGA
jgi:hypothetical protein